MEEEELVNQYDIIYGNHSQKGERRGTSRSVRLSTAKKTWIMQLYFSFFLVNQEYVACH